MAAEPPGEVHVNSAGDQVPEGRLNELVKLASARQAVKDYVAAADLYSQATELQAEINGEMAVTNADLLYAYGKCLYHVAVSKSDVLGSKIPASTSTEPKTGGVVESGADRPESSTDQAARVAAEPSEHGAVMPKQSQTQSYFQFTGDENFVDSDEEDASEPEDGPADDEDDFANAFETLDLARVLFLRKLEEIAPADDKNSNDADRASNAQPVRERLGDIYDLQAEISLEGEKFSDAVTDLQAALTIKQSLHTSEDPAIAECHYKLSLALEFSSVIRSGDEETRPAESAGPEFDAAMRKEAEKHMELAIESCKLRISKAEQKMNAGDIDDTEKASFLRNNIDDVKDIVSDMEQRLVELRRPPVSLSDAAEPDSADHLKGVLGSALEDVTKNANDLSSLVRKKNQQEGVTTEPSPPGMASNGNGKKRVFEESSVCDGQDATSKREKK